MQAEVTVPPERTHPAARSGPAGAATPAERTVRRDLEGLRGIAVIGVVVYHLRNSWLPGGFAGVDVFFVLSGFFITGLLLRESSRTGRVDLLAFWGRRARRLLPAAAVVLVATVVAGYLFVNALDAKRFATDGTYAAVFSVNWHLAQQGTDYLADTDPSPIQHFWSLGVEEQFYLVWPVILFTVAFAVRRRRRSAGGDEGGRHRRDRVAGPHRTVALIAAGAGVASFLYAWHLTHVLQSYAYFATYSRVWQLALGALIAASATALGRIPRGLRVPLRWTGVAAVVGFYALAPLDIVYPGWIAAVPTLGAAAIIVAGLPSAGASAVIPRFDVMGAAMSSRVGLWLGRYSYGWYLWHWPPLVLLPLYAGHRISGRSLVGCAVLSLAAAVVSYHVLEHPIRASKMLSAHRGRWSLALGAVLVVASVGTAQAITARADYKARHTAITVANGEPLTPNPGQEAARLSRPKQDDCELAQQSPDLAHECRYRPNTGHGDVVLVGDSHGAQWYPAVNQVAKENDWGLRVWTRQSCPFADVTKIYDGAPNQYCNRWRADVIARLLKDRPSLVILANLANEITQEVDPSTGKTVSGAAAQTLWLAGMIKELTVLRDAHIPVLVIRDNPAFQQYGPQCALEHPDSLQDCSLPRSQALLEPPLDMKAAAAVPGVGTMDVTDKFCSTSRCYQIVGSILAYHDYNHLTDTMDLTLAPELRAAAAKTLEHS